MSNAIQRQIMGHAINITNRSLIEIIGGIQRWAGMLMENF